MRKTICIVLLFVSISLVYCEEIAGHWVVQKTTKEFRGTRFYDISNLYNGACSVKVYGVYTFQAFYDEQNNELYFFVDVEKNNGDMTKFVFEGDIFIVYSLYNGKWNKRESYRKE